MQATTSLRADTTSGSAGVAGDVLRPLQRQGELLQQVLQRQLEFERELVPLMLVHRPARPYLSVTMGCEPQNPANGGSRKAVPLDGGNTSS